MKIHQLEIQNFKGFEKEVFNFNPHFTVLIGDNAKGKTTVLDALAILMGQFFQGLEKIEIPKIEEKQIRIKYISGQPKPQKPSILSAEGFLNQEKLLLKDWKVTNITENSCEKIKNIAKNILENSRHEKNAKKTSFPLIAYYGTGRLYKTSINNIDYSEQREGFEMAYLDALNIDISGRHFLSWFKTQLLSKESLTALEKKHTRVFKDTIISLFPNQDLQNISFNFKKNELSFIFYPEKNKKDKKVLWYSQLSDGYRNIIGLAADIAYRCIQLNPHLGENAVKNTEGIVLIDEIDLHLHPKWQRRIVGDLKRVFPKIQFVVTTHSPFIVQSLASDELINLEIQIDGSPEKQGLEYVSENIMGVQNAQRSLKYQQMLETAEKYFKLLENATKIEDKTQIQNLKNELDDLLIPFYEDAAFVSFLQIKKLAKLGE